MIFCTILLQGIIKILPTQYFSRRNTMELNFHILAISLFFPHLIYSEYVHQASELENDHIPSSWVTITDYRHALLSFFQLMAASGHGEIPVVTFGAMSLWHYLPGFRYTPVSIVPIPRATCNTLPIQPVGH